MSAGTALAWFGWLSLPAVVIFVCAWIDGRPERVWRARFDAMPQSERDAGCERLLAAIRAETHAGDTSPDRRPCKGRNANVCVAEGCYGEACTRVTPPADDLTDGSLREWLR